MITEELRKYVWEKVPSRHLEDLIGIADAIEQKHESVCCEIADKFYGWVVLPKDADGETIHLQDRMMWDNGTFVVHELNLTADGWTTWDELHGYTVRADQCHHVKPDSWERIIEDAMERGCMDFGSQQSRDALVERCKRLAGEDA